MIDEQIYCDICGQPGGDPWGGNHLQAKECIDALKEALENSEANEQVLAEAMDRDDAGLKAEVERLKGELATANGLLERLEWCGTGMGQAEDGRVPLDKCPVCGGHREIPDSIKNRIAPAGHSRKCALAAHLKDTTGEDAKEEDDATI